MQDMLGRGEAASVQQALSLISENLRQSPPLVDSIPIEESFGRVLASDITAPEDLPGFSRSTMDGFAVVSGDTFGPQAYLEVKGEVLMGETPSMALEQGFAIKIPTGGMLPEGADSVLMLEHAQRIDETTIEAQKPVSPGENIIRRGEDTTKGDVALLAGARLRPQDVACLAGMGFTDVRVFKQPLVAIISTGDEILPHSAPQRAGCVRDMNSFTLRGLIQKQGAVPVLHGIIRDDFELIKQAVLRAAAQCDMVLISGGSSVGTRDHTASVIAGSGRLLFHNVAMKPGKPLMAGIVGDKKPVFGLPGHPAAVMVCFETFVRPALRLLCGLPRPFKGDSDMTNTASARLSRSVRSAPGREDHIRVSLSREDGVTLAHPVLGKSGLIKTLTQAHGTIVVPPRQVGIKEGETVVVHLF